MVKLDYFNVLEELSQNVLTAVKYACSEGRGDERDIISQLRIESDKKICALEDALFSDFIPPLQRDSIAAFAHCLSRVIDRTADYTAELITLKKYCTARLNNEEATVCVELARMIAESTVMLRGVRSADKTPDLKKFRENLWRGREAHNAEFVKLNSGSIPRSCAQIIITTGKLRLELSRCFDELVEVMLNNI